MSASEERDHCYLLYVWPDRLIAHSARCPCAPLRPSHSAAGLDLTSLLSTGGLEHDETREGDRVPKDLQRGDGRSERNDRTSNKELGIRCVT
jgi:hypothetical protein